jgi:hypothetical protein
MTGRRKYRRREHTLVTAVRLALDMDGFEYRKWDHVQRCKPGDWIVDNGGDVYTIDADVFARTYAAAGDGRYKKIGTVWAEAAAADGSIPTKEGRTAYRAGDYLVFNDEAGTDGYAVTADKFHSLYEPA